MHAIPMCGGMSEPKQRVLQRRVFVSDVREQSGDEQVAEPTDTPRDNTPGTEGAVRETRVRATSGRVDSESGASAGEGGTESADQPENSLESEAEIAADYLEELLDIADLDGDIDTYIEGSRAHVSIVSQSEILVGARGEVLDALQELTRLAVMTETGDRSRLMLDVAGFRDRRRQELIDLATDAVQEARSTKEPVSLAPMNPFERKIVHDAVAAAGLRSESEGDEPKRHVVVQPTA